MTANPTLVLVKAPPTPTPVPATDECPLCEQPISRDKFAQISGRLASQERERAEEQAHKIHEALAEAKAALEAETAEKIKQASTAATSAATTAAAAKIKAADDARQAAELKATALAEAKAALEAHKAEDLRTQRESLERARDEAVNAEKAKSFNDRQKLEGQLQAMQRKLQRKTANELGEGAEVDLFEGLRKAFPTDKITRVGTGKAGADIVHEIIDRGRTAGRIVYDSKNRAAWRSDYVAKLRKDQIAASADHAVLAALAFPEGAHQVAVVDKVIVVNPARAIAMIEILRAHVIKMHDLAISLEARSEKSEQLYEFMNSDRFGQLWSEVDARTDDLLELDVKEQRQHDSTWSRRGALVKAIQKAHGTMTAEIESIVGQIAPVERND